MAIAPEPVSPHRSVDVQAGRSHDEEEILGRNAEAIRALDEVAEMGDEEEQLATLEALIPLSTRNLFPTAAVPLMRLVFLDTGTLGMVANPRGTSRAFQCQRWARNLLAAGVRVFVPEICDYEERRKLIHAGSTSGLARLDRLKIGFD